MKRHPIAITVYNGPCSVKKEPRFFGNIRIDDLGHGPIPWLLRHPYFKPLATCLDDIATGLQPLPVLLEIR